MAQLNTLDLQYGHHSSYDTAPERLSSVFRNEQATLSDFSKALDDAILIVAK